jgi:DNA polymerase V
MSTQMRASKISVVRTNYKFEAPVLGASAPTGLPKREFNLNNLLDLNSFLAPVPENCFLVRVSGQSMIDANINTDDILVVDKSETPRNGKIVIASLNGEMAVKYFQQNKDGTFLVSANKSFLPIRISELFEFQIQGVVKHVIKDI